MVPSKARRRAAAHIERCEGPRLPVMSGAVGRSSEYKMRVVDLHSRIRAAWVLDTRPAIAGFRSDRSDSTFRRRGVFRP